MAEKNDSMHDGRATADADQVETLKQSVARLARQLDDQNQRIEALARGREEGMRKVGELRAELALVTAERDQLRRRLTALEAMQTETLAFDDDPAEAAGGAPGRTTPSINELMENVSSEDELMPASHATLKVDADPPDVGGDEYEEMISPELIVLGSGGRPSAGSSERYLVLLEEDGQTNCPLNGDLLTIGRSDSADIQVEGDFISRIHARVLRIGMDSVIEDAGSKNGTRVNGELIRRHVLKHGDLVRVGSANFRFIDMQADNTGLD